MSKEISSKFAFNSIGALCLTVALAAQAVKHEFKHPDAPVVQNSASMKSMTNDETQEAFNVASLALLAGGFYILGMAAVIPGRRKQQEPKQG